MLRPTFYSKAYFLLHLVPCLLLQRSTFPTSAIAASCESFLYALDMQMRYPASIVSFKFYLVKRWLVNIMSSEAYDPDTVHKYCSTSCSRHQLPRWLWTRKNMQPLIYFAEQYGASKRRQVNQSFSAAGLLISSVRRKHLSLLGLDLRGRNSLNR